MINRRILNAVSGVGLFMCFIGFPFLTAAEGLTYTDDGLVYQPWFLDSFLILEEDLEIANNDGKRFVIFWELKGCPYCKETHRVNLAKPEILEFIKSNFAVLQLNVIGSRLATDFDGEELSEKELAQKWGVRFTPTIQFFSDNITAIKGKSGREAEVARIPGYFKPPHFLAMFHYVDERAYEKEKFHEYVKEYLKK